MDKHELLLVIIDQLTSDLGVQFNAALAAHEASTHEENIPDNKYETLALEASYLAQGQANRAQEIRLALQAYKQMASRLPDDDTSIGLGAIVTLAGDDAAIRTVFIGPREGGMKVTDPQTGSEIVVITPAAPLGRELLGKGAGEQVVIGSGSDAKTYEIVEVN